MEKTARAELIRHRFKKVCPSPYVPTGKTRAKPTEQPNEPALKVWFQWPEANRDTTRAGLWMHRANPKPKVAPKVKRNAGEVSTLTKIAKKTKRPKLPRLALREPWQMRNLQP